MKDERDQQLKARLRDVWTRTEPLIEERMKVLEDAAAAAGAGGLRPMQRAGAILAAHKLAGSLGMFGLSEASECARTMENALSMESPQAAELTGLLGRVRTLLQARKQEANG